jgi:hypothetical protein
VRNYARCNFDGSPLHPDDAKIMETFQAWLTMDETDRRLAVELGPEWQRFVWGVTLAERRAREARYLLTVTDEEARHLEKWLGSVLIIGPAHLQTMGTACFVLGLNAITEQEAEPIVERLRASGIVFHAGGPR